MHKRKSGSRRFGLLEIFPLVGVNICGPPILGPRKEVDQPGVRTANVEGSIGISLT